MNIVFFLPWPDKTLSPNARPHFMAISKAKKKAKTDAYYLAKQAGLDKLDVSEVHVDLKFYPPSRRKYDRDNLLAQHKAALDGISQAIGVDDSRFKITFDMSGAIEKNGMVRVQLTW